MLTVKIFDEYNLYRKHTFEFNEGITCLVGRNGSGKSTLLKEIKEKLQEDGQKVAYYDNEYSEKNNTSKFSFTGDYDKLARSMFASEGQNIRYNFEDYIPELGNYMRKRIKHKSDKCVVLLDGLDSGISLDYIVMLKKDLFPLILKDCADNNVKCYIIIAANNYELCNGEDCILVSTAKHIKFDSYDDFRKIYVK